MITDAGLAQLTLYAYEYDGKPFPWDWKTTVPGLDAGIKVIDGVRVLIFVGSRPVLSADGLEDWKRDFDALARTTVHPQLGRVHTGFYEGLDAFVAALPPAIPGQPLVAVGHSLGAGRAVLVTALLKAAGVSVDRLCCFAPPRAGMAQLAAFTAETTKALYRNVVAPHHDYVTDLPFTIPDLEPYCQPGPFTDVNGGVLSTDRFGLFAWHHMALYAQAVTGVKMADFYPAARESRN